MTPKKTRMFSDVFHAHVRRIAQDALIDMVIVYLAYTAGFLLRAVTTSLDFGQSMRLISFAILAHVTTLYIFGAYYRIWAKTSGHSITVLINAVASATTAILVIDLLVQPHPMPLSVVIAGSVFSLFGFTAVRYRSRIVSGLSWRWQAVWNHQFPKDQTRVLIIGAGDAGRMLALQLKYQSPTQSYEIVGFVDDDPDKQGLFVEGCKVLGKSQDIVALSEAHKVDLIVVAIHKISGSSMREILNLCEATNAMVKVAPDLFGLINQKTHAPELRDVQAEDLIGRSVISRGEGVDLTPIIGKTVLVTGAAGSIGSELCRQLVNFKLDKLILLDNNESGLHDISIELKTNFPELESIPVLADMTVPDQVRAVFKNHQPQIVFHAAAYKHVPMLQWYPNEGIRTNIHGTWHLAEFARDYGVERFVLISTDKAVNPMSVMGATKRICELILHMISRQGNHKTLFTSVRFGNVLGSRGSVVPTFTRQIDLGGPVTVTDPAMTRYFMSIPEAANLVVHAACLTHGDDIFILKMGDVVRIVELAERMIRIRGLRPYVDIPIKFTGMRPGEKMHEELFDPSECPSETAHPHIIKIYSWDNDYGPEEFFNNLEYEMGRYYPDSDEALRALRALAHAHQSASISVKSASMVINGRK